MGIYFAPEFCPDIDVLHFVVRCPDCEATDGRTYSSADEAIAARGGALTVVCSDVECAAHLWDIPMEVRSVLSDDAATHLAVGAGSAHDILVELGFDSEIVGRLYGECSAFEMAQRLETHPMSRRDHFEQMFAVVQAATRLKRDVAWF